MKKQRILADFFLKYPYKKNIILSANTIPYPYVKKSDVSDHPMTIDYNEYRVIIERYLQMIGDDVINGIDYHPKGKIGFIGFKKFKFGNKGLINYAKTRDQGKLILDMTRGQDKYGVKSAWERYKRSFVNRVSWRVKINTNLYRRVYEIAEKDYTHIYKFKDA